jgi:hypothetical protein
VDLESGGGVDLLLLHWRPPSAGFCHGGHGSARWPCRKNQRDPRVSIGLESRNPFPDRHRCVRRSWPPSQDRYQSSARVRDPSPRPELARVSCETPADLSAIRVLSADRQSLVCRALHHGDPAQGDVVRAMLKDRAISASLGDSARVLESGKSEVARRVQPAIVLCDLGLPDLDGYAVAADSAPIESSRRSP